MWSGAVIRGDLNSIRVNAFSSIGDRSVIHAARCSMRRHATAIFVRALLTCYFLECACFGIATDFSLHVHRFHDRSSPTGLPASTTIGRHVVIGQSCLLRSCQVQHEAVIGDRCGRSAFQLCRI